jgi:hypothetical protein
MNKKQIIAELRRSATDDEFPFMQVEWDAIEVAFGFRGASEQPGNMDRDALGTFYLLVAEALEHDRP